MGRQGKEKQLPETVIFLPRKLCTGKEVEVTGADVNTESIGEGGWMLRDPVKYPRKHLFDRLLIFPYGMKEAVTFLFSTSWIVFFSQSFDSLSMLESDFGKSLSNY